MKRAHLYQYQAKRKSRELSLSHFHYSSWYDYLHLILINVDSAWLRTEYYDFNSLQASSSCVDLLYQANWNWLLYILWILVSIHMEDKNRGYWTNTAKKDVKIHKHILGYKCNLFWIYSSDLFVPHKVVPDQTNEQFFGNKLYETLSDIDDDIMGLHKYIEEGA
jgi:hypothetical protein